MRKMMMALSAALASAMLLAGSAMADNLSSISVCAGSEDAMILNAAHVDTLEGMSACRHIFEGLYKLDQEGNIVLGQAASVETSEDGLTWTFTLRDDITWSDGEKVKAQDFIYSWDYLISESDAYSSLMNMVSEYTAPDEQTLVLKLAFPCAYLPSILCFPSTYPVRQDLVEEYGESYATDPDKSVYNGAYIVTDWTHQASLTMQKRAEYYDADSITVDEIQWQLMSDNNTKQAAFQSGEIIFSDGVVEETAASLEGMGLQYESGYNNYTCLFNLANGNEVLQDVNVRKALLLAVNRERLVTLRNMNDTVAYTYTPAGLTGSDGTDFISTVSPWYSEDYEANCEEAKKLLAEAGYENGEGFPALRYIVGNNDRKAIAEAVTGDWNHVLGIDTITVETVENFFTARQTGDFDIAYFGWYMDYPDISNMLGTMVTGANDGGYSSEAYDEAYNSAIAEEDEAAQWESYRKCEEILAEDVPVIPFFLPQTTFLFDDASYDGMVYYCGNNFFGYLTAK